MKERYTKDHNDALKAHLANLVIYRDSSGARVEGGYRYYANGILGRAERNFLKGAKIDTRSLEPGLSHINLMFLPAVNSAHLIPVSDPNDEGKTQWLVYDPDGEAIMQVGSDEQPISIKSEDFIRPRGTRRQCVTTCVPMSWSAWTQTSSLSVESHTLGSLCRQSCQNDRILVDQSGSRCKLPNYLARFSPRSVLLVQVS